MTDAKTRRRETANRIRVKASPARMDRTAFESRYMERNVIIGREEIEARCQEMFCDECAEPYGTAGALLLRTLHISIEDDPLRNFWKLARAKCFGCGFEELIPLEKPDFSGSGTFGPVLDVWEEEREKFHTDLKRKDEERRMRMMNQAAAQQQTAAQTAAQIQMQQAHGLQRLNALANSLNTNLSDEYARMVKEAEDMLKAQEPVPQPIVDRIRALRKRLAGR